MSVTMMDNYSSFYAKLLTYPLASAYDLSSILDGVLASSDNGSSFPSDIKFNKDGTKCYVCDYSTRNIYQYSLIVPYVIGQGGKSFDGNVNLSTDVGTSGLYGMSFNTTGDCLYIIDQSADKMLKYNVSTPFDLTSTVTLDKTFLLNDIDATPGGLDMSSIGHKLYFAGWSSSKFFSLDLIF
jgi:DNA-binding beta-propeller fold protein YncE